MVIATCVVSLDNKGIYSQVKCLIKYTNLVIINIYSGRMTREVDGQQTQSVIYRLFARNVPFQTLLNFVKPVQTQ
ncbi:hypothetical protein EA242_23430 [Escherichia coli]|nr:hypothetical protein EA242_23430 [Escherichia coli]